MQTKTIIATAAAMFAASAFTVANAQTPVSPTGHGIASKDCKGVNACKGQNACKGKGWLPVNSQIECTVLQSK